MFGKQPWIGKKDLHQADDSSALAASNSLWFERMVRFWAHFFWTARNQQDIPRHQPSFRVASNSKAMQRRNEIASRAKTYCAIALPHDEWSRSDPADPGDRVDWDSLRWLWSLMVPRVTHVEIRFLMDEVWQADFWRCEFGFLECLKHSQAKLKAKVQEAQGQFEMQWDFSKLEAALHQHMKCAHI